MFEMSDLLEFKLRRETEANYFDTLSFLQKSIREGKLDSALYWAYEITNDKQGKTAVFNKMRTESCEDIGLANPEAIVIIDELLKSYSNNPDDKFWIAGIKYLCESPKNREVDWYLIGAKKILIEHRNFSPKDYNSLQEALNNKDESEAFYYAYNTKENPLWGIILKYRNDQVIQALQHSFNTVGKTTRGRDLFWSMVLLMIIRNIPSPLINISKRTQDVLDSAKLLDVTTIPRPTIPDYYYDKHTKRGYTLGRGTTAYWYSHIKLNPYQTVPGEYWEILVKQNLKILDKKEKK